MKRATLILLVAIALMMTGCKPNYETLYVQKHINTEKDGGVLIMNDDSFKIKIAVRNDDVWIATYTEKNDDGVYHHLSIMNEDGSLMEFQDRKDLELVIENYGYEVVTQEEVDQSGSILYYFKKIQ